MNQKFERGQRAAFGCVNDRHPFFIPAASVKPCPSAAQIIDISALGYPVELHQVLSGNAVGDPAQLIDNQFRAKPR